MMIHQLPLLQITIKLLKRFDNQLIKPTKKSKTVTKVIKASDKKTFE